MQDWRKRFHALWMSLDFKPKKIKKSIESSNRWKAKREIRKHLRDIEQTEKE